MKKARASGPSLFRRGRNLLLGGLAALGLAALLDHVVDDRGEDQLHGEAHLAAGDNDGVAGAFRTYRDRRTNPA